jgi:hypothetical protein
MTREEFVKNCCSIGYCTKVTAEAYSRDKDVLTDDDYIEVYRMAERIEKKLNGDGTRSYGRHGARSTKHFRRDGGEEGNR